MWCVDRHQVAVTEFPVLISTAFTQNVAASEQVPHMRAKILLSAALE